MQKINRCSAKNKEIVLAWSKSFQDSKELSRHSGRKEERKERREKEKRREKWKPRKIHKNASYFHDFYLHFHKTGKSKVKRSTSFWWLHGAKRTEITVQHWHWMESLTGSNCIGNNVIGIRMNRRTNPGRNCSQGSKYIDFIVNLFKDVPELILPLGNLEKQMQTLLGVRHVFKFIQIFPTKNIRVKWLAQSQR